MSRRSTIWAAVLLITAAAPANAENIPDFLMGTDPEFVAPPLVKDFKRDFHAVWLQALRRPEADYQRMAAESVVAAHQIGIPKLTDLVPALEAIVVAPTSHPSARFAAARALIVLDARAVAPRLFDSGQKHGSDLRQLVEPALAEWDFISARGTWITRLEAKDTFPRDLILAIRCLGKVRDVSALPAISQIAMDVMRPAHIRLEAARSAGEIVESGLESNAENTAHDQRLSPLINRLCAIGLLARHSSEVTCRLLTELAADADPSVSAAALKRLNEIDPILVVPMAEKAMKNADPLVRLEGAKACVRVPSTERIVRLVALLDDDHPAVRKWVGSALYQLAKNPEFDSLIRAESMRILAQDRWQGQEQAALLLGLLEHQAAAERFVELLESTRPEVMIHTAWGLRKLGKIGTIHAIIGKIRRQTDARRGRTIPGVEQQVAHLFEACGQMKAQEAASLMMEYVPKDRSMDVARSAAIWALGKVFVGTPQSSIGEALLTRIQDNDPTSPESPYVKQMCLVTLVSMKETEFASEIRATVNMGVPPTALGLATRWALRELTGELLPEPVPRPFPEGIWFLEPVDSPVTRQP